MNLLAENIRLQQLLRYTMHMSKHLKCTSANRFRSACSHVGVHRKGELNIYLIASQVEEVQQEEKSPCQLVALMYVNNWLDGAHKHTIL